MGEFLPTLGERLLAAAELLAYVQKDGYNDHHKYNYVSEAAIKAAVSKAYRQVGLYIAGVKFSPVVAISANTNIVMEASVFVCGVGLPDSVVFTGIGQGSDKQDKAAMKASAAALKYALTSAHLIATGDDPEATEGPEAAPAAKTKSAAVDQMPIDQASLGSPKSVATAVAALLRDIADAPSTTELEHLKPRIKSLTGTPEYDNLKQVFSSRKSALAEKGK